MCKVYIVICKVCSTQYTVHSTQYVRHSPALTLASLLRMVPAVLEMEHLYSCVYTVSRLYSKSLLSSLLSIFFKRKIL